MHKIKFIGGTGSGKTFSAIKEAEKLGKYAYLAPCRQLAYETAIKYGNPDCHILTGEFDYVGSKLPQNYFGVYEIAESVINDVDTIIIDEAHFITDEDRGALLWELSQREDKNIFLCTATDNFEIESFEVRELPSRFEFKKEEISFGEFWERVENGVSSILFCRSIREAESYENSITANTPAAERLRLQLAFAKGEINFIACTNVLAQGLNFPCENLMIQDDWNNTPEIMTQKLGRLGRPFITKKGARLTYHIDEDETVGFDFEKRKISKEKQRYKINLDSWEHRQIKETLSPEGWDKYVSIYEGRDDYQDFTKKYGESLKFKFYNSLSDRDKFELADLGYSYSSAIRRMFDLEEQKAELKKIIKAEWKASA